MQLKDKNDGVQLSTRYQQYIFAKLYFRGTRRPEVFPIGGTNGKDIEPNKRREADIFPTIRATHYKSGDNQPLIRQLNNLTNSNDRVYGTDGISPTLNTMQGGNRQPFIACEDLSDVVSYQYGKTSKLDDGTLESKTKLRNKNGDMFSVQNKKENRDTSLGRGLAQQQSGESSRNMQELPHQIPQKTTKLQSGDMQSDTSEIRLLRETQPTVQEIRQSSSFQEESTQPYSVRRLTAMECERLQGFPDGWTQGVSDTQRYKCLVNTVTVNVVREIVSVVLMAISVPPTR